MIMNITEFAMFKIMAGKETGIVKVNGTVPCVGFPKRNDYRL